MFTFACSVYNLVRLRKLLIQPAQARAEVCPAAETNFKAVATASRTSKRRRINAFLHRTIFFSTLRI
jgi:hypothetical protein